MQKWSTIFLIYHGSMATQLCFMRRVLGSAVHSINGDWKSQNCLPAGWRGGGSGTRRKKGATLAVIILRLTDKMPAQERPRPAARTIRPINISQGGFSGRDWIEFNLFSTSGHFYVASLYTSRGFLIKLAINLINLNMPSIVKYQFQEARIASSINSLGI